VRSRILLLVVSVGVFKLSGGNFSSFDWLISVLSMYRWLVLRQHRTDSHDRSVRSGIFLLVVSVVVFELSGEHISSFDWLIGVLSMYRWLVLRHRRTDSRDRSVRCGILLVVFSDRVFKLSCRNLLCIDVEHKLH